MREIFWDAETRQLLALPMAELAALRNGTLYKAAAEVKLAAGELFTLPLPTGAAAASSYDLEASFALGTAATAAAGAAAAPEGSGPLPLSFGVSVLANSNTTLSSTVITINCSAATDPKTGGRSCVVAGGIAKPPPPPAGQAPPIAPAWAGSQLVNLSRMMPNVSFPGAPCPRPFSHHRSLSFCSTNLIFAAKHLLLFLQNRATT
eukprot:SAG22_NODE_808_length_7080_cov_4.802034_1_plen_204_part_10